MFSKKQYIILIILIIVLIGGIFLFKQKFSQWPWQRKADLVSPTATVSPTPSGSESPQTKDAREIVMEDAAKKIAELSPVAPVLGGKWFAERFWFIDGSNNSFYVEYEDGHILRKLLLTADTSQAPEKISYHIDAYFETGADDWVLKSGKDQNSGLPLILYEYDDNLKRWIRKN